ncbi:hypothetical protein E2562_019980 [Oryza meyeriana var. granulata]|uniref:Disease resistance R13L4/SHOC-2-like LRR domain-containing protein n=1 Tax=Oryza meyeriana var. granulata TaxID=110450 RepID=A0A6G1CHH6_9ORYZ|nr:hypothetical protein E2562_019980 [Oryza meyeriana var. granulata]
MIKSLRTLEMFHPPDMDIKALGELTNLRELRLCFDLEETGAASNLDALGSVIFDGNDRLSSLSAFPRSIEILKLETWRFSRVPRWINTAFCNLRLLELAVSATCTDEVGVLGRVAHLQLHVEMQIEGIIVFGASGGSFPALEFLFLSCGGDAASQLNYTQAPGARSTVRSL